MRVVLVTNDFPPAPGGIQRYFDDLVRHAPWDVHILAPAHGSAPQDGRVSRYDRSLQPTRRATSWIAGQVENLRPDVVLYAALPLALAGPGVAERTGVPYALFLHGAEVTIPTAVPGARGRYSRAIVDAGARFSVSQYTGGRIEARLGVPVTWVGAGVDVDVFSPGEIGHEHFIVGCVGRFVQRKGHERVLRAVASLREGEVQAGALLVGWGPKERRLRRTAVRLGVPTDFLIEVSQHVLADAYRRMDVFAMPVRSRWAGLEVEGLGLVYLEAAASGLPVIAGMSGGAPETVQDGITGFVVGDQRQLVEALRTLHTDPELARSMGSAGRRRVERSFTWEAVMGRVDVQLREVTGG